MLVHFLIADCRLTVDILLSQSLLGYLSYTQQVMLSCALLFSVLFFLALDIYKNSLMLSDIM